MTVHATGLLRHGGPARCAGIVLAAGSGQRFGEKKQFSSLSGKPLVIYSLSFFQCSPLIDDIVCVVPKEDLEFMETLLIKYNLSKVNKLLAGGSDRQASAAAAVSYLAEKKPGDHLAAVHDGVRPFLSSRLLESLIQETELSGAAVAARRVTDSLKSVSETRVIQKTLPREGVWAMQTPQVFRLSILSEAYRKGTADHFSATDEAMLVERLGVPVVCVEGTAENIKITTTQDLKFAEFLLNEGAVCL